MNEVPKSVADHQQLLRTAFDAYLEQLSREGLEPSEGYLPYDFEEAIDTRHWLFGKTNVLVKDELRYLTNELNRWHEALRRWHAWNKVIHPYNKNEAWRLRREFLESLVFYCLFQPASSRDRFTFVVTNAMHQVRLMTEEHYQDCLQGDPQAPDEIKKSKYLNRPQQEKRLSKLISIWPEREEFMTL